MDWTRDGSENILKQQQQQQEKTYWDK